MPQRSDAERSASRKHAVDWEVPSAFMHSSPLLKNSAVSSFMAVGASTKSSPSVLRGSSILGIVRSFAGAPRLAVFETWVLTLPLLFQEEP